MEIHRPSGKKLTPMLHRWKGLHIVREEGRSCFQHWALTYKCLENLFSKLTRLLVSRWSFNSRNSHSWKGWNCFQDVFSQKPRKNWRALYLVSCHFCLTHISAFPISSQEDKSSFSLIFVADRLMDTFPSGTYLCLTDARSYDFLWPMGCYRYHVCWGLKNS